MLGALAGDVIGSMIEYKGIKDKNFPLFDRFNNFTDDSVLILALADALMNNREIKDAYVEWGKEYIHKDYGGNFRQWLTDPYHTPYNSFGNGSAMRVAAIPYISRNIAHAEALAIQSALPSHNHPQGVVGACATAVAGRMALEGYSKREISDAISCYYHYDLSKTISEIRPTYKYEISCQKSVPESIIAFLESNDFEDAMRNTISLGGDADTMGAITGAIAYPFYKKDASFDRIWDEIISRKIFDERSSIIIDQFIHGFLQKDYQKSDIQLKGIQTHYITQEEQAELDSLVIPKLHKPTIKMKVAHKIHKIGKAIHFF